MMNDSFAFFRRNNLIFGRVATLVVSSICALLSLNIVMKHFGLLEFGRYTLLISLTSLLPFLNLGVRTLIYNQFAASGKKQNPSQIYSDQEFFSSIFFILAIFAIGTFLVSQTLATSLLNLNRADLQWGRIILFMTCISAPFSSGNFLLNARNKILINVFISLLTPLFTLAGAVLAVKLEMGFQVAATAPIMGYFANCLVSFVLAKAHKLLRIKYVSIVRLRFFFGSQILGLGFLTLICESIFQFAINSPRYIFASLHAPNQLAEYSVFLIFFLPTASIFLPKITQISIENRIGNQNDNWLESRKGLVKSAFFLGIAFSFMLLSVKQLDLNLVFPSNVSILFFVCILVLWVICQIDINASIEARDFRVVIFGQLFGVLLMLMSFLIIDIFPASLQVCLPLLVFLSASNFFTRFSVVRRT